MIKNKEPKKEFEEKLKPQAEEASPEPERKGWFNWRKKKPVKRRTAEEIAQERLSQAMTIDPKQIDLFIPVLKIPFDVWAKNIKLEELRLKNDEAKNLATPVAQLINYYLPRLSPIGYVWLSFGITSFGIMQVRLKLLADLRKEKQNKSKEKAKEKG